MSKLKVAVLLLFINVILLIPYTVQAAEPEITVRTKVMDERVEIGSYGTVAFRFLWTDSEEALEEGAVNINGRNYYIPPDGWVIINEVHHEVDKIDYVLEQITYQGDTLSYQMEDDIPFIIWDKVIIELYSVEERIGVGQTPTILVDSYYAYDYFNFNGTVILSDIEAHTQVGEYEITVKKVYDEEYELKDFDANTITVIWDEVDIHLWKESNRFGVGEEAQVNIDAKYKYDGQRFYGDIHFNDSLIQSVVGDKTFTVANITDHVYDVTSFESNDISFIFDKIHINLTAEDLRINVGEEPNITWTASHEYDGSDFMGNIVFNTNLNKSIVTEKVVEIKYIRDLKYSVEAFDANSLKVIWDRIKVELDTDDKRVDVGELVNVSINAYYEYDSTSVNSNIIRLNNNSYMMDEVGSYQFKVESVGENQHDISEFKSNDLEVIWDSITVNLLPPSDRVIVGTSKNPEIQAFYSFDETVYRGKYTLNKPFNPAVGELTYCVISVSDTLHGLSEFTSNEVKYHFDEIFYELTRSNMMPGSIEYTYNIRYVSDKAPVNNAQVYVNNQPCNHLGNGIYTISLATLMPHLDTTSKIDINGYTIDYSSASTISVGNSALISVIALIVVVLVLRKSLFEKEEETEEAFDQAVVDPVQVEVQKTDTT